MLKQHGKERDLNCNFEKLPNEVWEQIIRFLVMSNAKKGFVNTLLGARKSLIRVSGVNHRIRWLCNRWINSICPIMDPISNVFIEPQVQKFVRHLVISSAMASLWKDKYRCAEFKFPLLKSLVIYGGDVDTATMLESYQQRVDVAHEEAEFVARGILLPFLVGDTVSTEVDLIVLRPNDVDYNPFVQYCIQSASIAAHCKRNVTANGGEQRRFTPNNTLNDEKAWIQDYEIYWVSFLAKLIELLRQVAVLPKGKFINIKIPGFSVYEEERQNRRGHCTDYGRNWNIENSNVSVAESLMQKFYTKVLQPHGEFLRSQNSISLIVDGSMSLSLSRWNDYWNRWMMHFSPFLGNFNVQIRRSFHPYTGLYHDEVEEKSDADDSIHAFNFSQLDKLIIGQHPSWVKTLLYDSISMISLEFPHLTKLSLGPFHGNGQYLDLGLLVFPIISNSLPNLKYLTLTDCRIEVCHRDGMISGFSNHLEVPSLELLQSDFLNSNSSTDRTYNFDELAKHAGYLPSVSGPILESIQVNSVVFMESNVFRLFQKLFTTSRTVSFSDSKIISQLNNVESLLQKGEFWRNNPATAFPSFLNWSNLEVTFSGGGFVQFSSHSLLLVQMLNCTAWERLKIVGIDLSNILFNSCFQESLGLCMSTPKGSSLEEKKVLQLSRTGVPKSLLLQELEKVFDGVQGPEIQLQME